MKKIITRGVVLMAIAFPILVLAQNSDKNLSDIARTATSYFQVAITLIISLAILYFVWNVFRYFFTPDVSPEKKKEAGLYVLYSVIGFFVIISIWGLVNILKNTFNLPNNNPGWPFNITIPGPSSGSYQDNLGNTQGPRSQNLGDTQGERTRGPL